MSDDKKTRTLGAIVFDGFELLDLYGPLEMFGSLGPDLRIETVSETRGPVRSGPGPETVAQHGFADAPDFDLILQPGATTPLAGVAEPGTKVCILIGPEGGFSQTEYEDAEVAGFRAVSLGPRVLRTETAAAAALAIMQATWGDLSQA